MSFNEFRVRGTGFYAITEPTLDDGKDCLNHPPFTVQTDNTAEQPSKEEVYSLQGFVTTPLLMGLKTVRYPYNPELANKTSHGGMSPISNISQAIVPSNSNVFSQFEIPHQQPTLA